MNDGSLVGCIGPPGFVPGPSTMSDRLPYCTVSGGIAVT